MKIVDASIIGSSHRKLFYNNQDGCKVVSSEDYVIGIVADGCGNGMCSEVGANLAVEYLINHIQSKLCSEEDWIAGLEKELELYVRKLVELYATNGANEFIHDFLLYTIVGFVLTNDEITFFHSGDGYYCFNNEVVDLDEGNRPNYFNYFLISGIKSKIKFDRRSYNGEFVFVSTDGLRYLIEEVENKKPYYCISKFLNRYELLDNPIGLSKLLAEYSDKSILKDDCSIILLG